MYQIKFLGPTENTSEARESVKTKLIEIFNISEEQANKLLDNCPCVIKTSEDRELLSKIVNLLLQCDARAELVDTSPGRERTLSGSIETSVLSDEPIISGIITDLPDMLIGLEMELDDELELVEEEEPEPEPPPPPKPVEVKEEPKEEEPKEEKPKEVEKEEEEVPEEGKAKSEILDLGGKYKVVVSTVEDNELNFFEKHRWYFMAFFAGALIILAVAVFIVESS